MKFVYGPLPRASGSDTFRVIDLEPASNVWDPIICTLSNVTLSPKPAYEALSYVWGPQNALHSILCNGADFHVGLNLHDALRRLRLNDRSRKLWIDAICINQADPIEKAHQITLMRQIYSQSERTLIWLGVDEEDDQWAFQLIADLLASYALMSNKGDSRTFVQMMPHEVQAYRIPGMDGNKKPFRALKTLLDREWFQRAWIIQEASLPPRLSMYCGSYEIDWDEFIIALAFIPKIGLEYNFTNLGGTRGAAHMIAQLRLETQNNKRNSLLQLLCRSSQCLSTDPRDRIFSLCGLASDAFENGLNVKISYLESYTAKDAYIDFAISVIKKTKSLDILSAPRRLDETNPLELPSWVPDWTMTHEMHPLRVQFGDLPQNVFCASMYSHIDLEEIPLEAKILKTQGILVDTIDRLGVMAKIWKVSEAMERWRIDTQKTMNWMEITQADSNTPYINGEKRIDAFWQTGFGGHYAASYDEAKEIFYRLYGSLQRSIFYMNLRLPYFPKLMSVVKNLDNAAQWLTSGFMSSSRLNQLTAVQAFRKMAVSQTGYYCLAPSIAQSGDFIAILKGGDVPFLLRKLPQSDKWTLIGEIYVHGIMKGEIWNESECQDIEIV